MSLREKVKPGVSRRNDFSLMASKSALLVIDIQSYLSYAEHEYFNQESFPRAIKKIEELAQRFRCVRDHSAVTSGCEVIFTYLQSATKDGRDISLDYKLSGPVLANIPRVGDDNLFCDGCHPDNSGKGDILLPKTSCSVFQSTNLDYLLRNLGIEQLVITGQLTEQCVESAVRDAADLGYYVTVVDDCCAAYTALSHQKGLESMQGFCRILKTDEVIVELADDVARCRENPLAIMLSDSNCISLDVVSSFLQERGFTNAADELSCFFSETSRFVSSNALAYDTVPEIAMPEQDGVTSHEDKMESFLDSIEEVPSHRGSVVCISSDSTIKEVVELVARKAGSGKSEPVANNTSSTGMATETGPEVDVVRVADMGRCNIAKTNEHQIDDDAASLREPTCDKNATMNVSKPTTMPAVSAPNGSVTARTPSSSATTVEERDNITKANIQQAGTIATDKTRSLDGDAAWLRKRVDEKNAKTKDMALPKNKPVRDPSIVAMLDVSQQNESSTMRTPSPSASTVELHDHITETNAYQAPTIATDKARSIYGDAEWLRWRVDEKNAKKKALALPESELMQDRRIATVSDVSAQNESVTTRTISSSATSVVVRDHTTEANARQAATVAIDKTRSIDSDAAWLRKRVDEKNAKTKDVAPPKSKPGRDPSIVAMPDDSAQNESARMRAPSPSVTTIEKARIFASGKKERSPVYAITEKATDSSNTRSGGVGTELARAEKVQDRNRLDKKDPPDYKTKHRLLIDL